MLWLAPVLREVRKTVEPAIRLQLDGEKFAEVVGVKLEQIGQHRRLLRGGGSDFKIRGWPRWHGAWEVIGGPGRDRTDDLFHAMELAKSYRADGKGFKSRTSRQKPLKSARFATRMLPKRVLPICYQTNSGRGLTAGDQPFSSLWLAPLLSRSASNFTFHSAPYKLSDAVNAAP